MANQSQLEADVISVIESMVADWDLEYSDGINPETKLMEDLAFESIDVVQLVVNIERKLGRKDIPFEQLFLQDGDYVEEVQIKDVIYFLQQQLQQA